MSTDCLLSSPLFLPPKTVVFTGYLSYGADYIIVFHGLQNTVAHCFYTINMNTVHILGFIEKGKTPTLLGLYHVGNLAVVWPWLHERSVLPSPCTVPKLPILCYPKCSNPSTANILLKLFWNSSISAQNKDMQKSDFLFFCLWFWQCVPKPAVCKYYHVTWSGHMNI
jgi:hypothetical protein